ncbi:hypothetical protein [Sphingomonas sp.]|uniref:HPr kinase/phosphorylase n=1 Tax=Sphingomonas sp. TaxID=28214 RepID=UPI00286B65D2|nr:hypothetical protein [Sphingomonas sp.]
MTMVHHHELFGLSLRSQLPLPELGESVSGGAADVRISIDPELDVVDGGQAIAVEGIATYAVIGGRHIIVRPEPGAATQNVRLYLLGSAMGMLLHQRGVLPLHANAIDVGGRVVAFAGPSGSGKSTLALWFADHGHRVIADDVCAIRIDDAGRPMVSPGIPRLRLWREAIEASGRSVAGFERSYAGDESFDKYDMPGDRLVGRSRDRSLAALYILERGQRFAIEPLGGVDAAEAVFANTYRGHYVARAKNAGAHLRASMALIGTTPLFRVTRCWGFERLHEEAEAIARHAADIAARSLAAA